MRTSWLKYSSAGNRLQVEWNIEKIFNIWIQDIEQARSEIYLFTYIFAPDSVGHRFQEALIRAAKRGVRVFLAIDDYGSSALTGTFLRSFQIAGVHVIRFRPLSDFLTLRSLIFRRLHQKILCIDQMIAHVGGVNITESEYKMLDCSARLTGPLAARIARYCKIFVLRQRRDWKSFLKTRLKEIPDQVNESGVRAAFLIRNNFQFRTQIEKAYIEAIQQAQERVWIANAYFMPRRRVQRALFDAAGRGVDVRVVVQGISDLPLITDAIEIFYEKFLKHGVKLYEFHSSILHAKVALIDRQWSTIGSANLDVMSLRLSLEANLLVLDSQVNENMEKTFRETMFQDANTRAITQLKPTTLGRRIRRWVSYLIFRVFSFFALRKPYKI